MFDIACVMKTHGVEYLDEALEAFQDKCEAALKVARQMNQAVRGNHHDETLYRESFSDIPRVAQSMTVELLETICTGAKT
ncbi:hypothetical protein [Sinorhizobium meliloti]|uniref:hypothetical protein n=2 Tax=Rhizobium meliloti TaxID=382 RepID=UPI001F459648